MFHPQNHAQKRMNVFTLLHTINNVMYWSHERKWYMRIVVVEVLRNKNEQSMKQV